MIRWPGIRMKLTGCSRHFLAIRPKLVLPKCSPLLILLLPLSHLQAQQTEPFSKTINIKRSNEQQHCVPCVILTETKKGDHIVRGKVVDFYQQPIKGASVFVKELIKFAKSDSLGYFCFRSDIPTDTLHVTAHLAGYIGQELEVVPGNGDITIFLQGEPANSLPNVTIIGCFRQTICKTFPPLIVSFADWSDVNKVLTGRLPEINFQPLFPITSKELSDQLIHIIY